MYWNKNVIDSKEIQCRRVRLNAGLSFLMSNKWKYVFAFFNLRLITLGVYFRFGKGITFVSRRKFHSYDKCLFKRVCSVVWRNKSPY